MMKELSKKDEVRILHNVTIILAGAQGILESIGREDLIGGFYSLGGGILRANDELRKEVKADGTTMDTTNDRRNRS